VRVSIEAEQALVPEVSANRYQIGIRFFRLEGSARELYALPLPFSLQQCVL
jgi:cell division FtsZ-interacting protein ZapD